MFACELVCVCVCVLLFTCSQHAPSEDKKTIRQEAESIAKTMNLSVVRLCCQVSPVLYTCIHVYTCAWSLLDFFLLLSFYLLYTMYMYFSYIVHLCAYAYTMYMCVHACTCTCTCTCAGFLDGRAWQVYHSC